MITSIGIVSGKILDLLDKSNGVMVFGEIHSSLNESRDLVLMSLGDLLHKGYLIIMEDPWRGMYQDDQNKRFISNEACMFDLVIGNNADGKSGKRIKNMAEHVGEVGRKILVLLEGCGDLLSLQTLESNLKESRDIILMGLGWLIRDGHVQGIVGTHEIFILRAPAKAVGFELEVFSHA